LRHQTQHNDSTQLPHNKKNKKNKCRSNKKNTKATSQN
jgi:hypothetical protein